MYVEFLRSYVCNVSTLCYGHPTPSRTWKFQNCPLYRPKRIRKTDFDGYNAWSINDPNRNSLQHWSIFSNIKKITTTSGGIVRGHTYHDNWPTSRGNSKIPKTVMESSITRHSGNSIKMWHSFVVKGVHEKSFQKFDNSLAWPLRLNNCSNPKFLLDAHYVQPFAIPKNAFGIFKYTRDVVH